MKCERCGKCCLHSPCMIIPIPITEEAKNRYIKKYYKGNVHNCKFFSIDKDGLATCRAYKIVKSKNGDCTSGPKLRGEY